MKRPLFLSLVAVTMLTAAAGAAHAQPVASMAKAGVVHAEPASAGVVKVGWKVKRRTNAGHRNARRAHRNSGLGLRGSRRSAAMIPYIPGGLIMHMLKNKKKHDRCELIPGGC